MINIDEIKVLSISAIEDRGALRAFVEIQLGNFVISDCRIIKEDGKKPWVSMPVLSYKNQQGTVCYKPLVRVTDASLKNQISEVVIRAFEKENRGLDETGSNY